MENIGKKSFGKKIFVLGMNTLFCVFGLQTALKNQKPLARERQGLFLLDRHVSFAFVFYKSKTTKKRLLGGSQVGEGGGAGLAGGGGDGVADAAEGADGDGGVGGVDDIVGGLATAAVGVGEEVGGVGFDG